LEFKSLEFKKGSPSEAMGALESAREMLGYMGYCLQDEASERLDKIQAC